MPDNPDGYERVRRDSTFSVVEVPRSHNPNMPTIKEKEGLANIEFNDVDATTTFFVNPLHAEASELDGDTLADIEQADCILDELGVHDKED